MPKRKRVDPAIQQQLEQERLNSLVNLSGDGESEVVKAVLSPEFTQMTDMNAGQIALLLQELIRGQNSLLAKINDQESTIASLKQKWDNADKLISRQTSTERKEIEAVLQRAEKLKLTGDKKEKLVARAGKLFTQAVKSARAKNASDKLAFEQQLATMPQVTVVAPGQFITVREGQGIVPKIIPTEIRIKHKVWYLPPGRPTSVPKIVADRLHEIMNSQQETSALKNVLGKNMEQGKLAQEWNKVEGTKRQPLPLA